MYPFSDCSKVLGVKVLVVLGACSIKQSFHSYLVVAGFVSSITPNQARSRLRNRDRKPSRFDSRSSRFRFEPIRVETSKSRFVIDFFNFDFGIYICMFSEKSVLFRYYRNVTDSYRKYVMTIKITVLLPIFFPPSLFHRFDTDVYNK